jgi:diguanylate cyclase (GGDEF)-like protein/PAS domain S-box-containing protein
MSAFLDPDVYRSILESLPSGLCVVDMDKKILLWSNGAERITGHLRHEVIGRCYDGEAMLHCRQEHSDWCNEDSPLARTIKTSQPAEASGFLHHKAGHEIPIHARAVPVHNAHGSIIGAVETFEEQQTTDSDHREEALNLPGCIDEAIHVPNHVMMQSHLREALGTFSEVQVPFGVLAFQLDGLENFRANFGSDAATSLLRVIARTLEGALWKTDFVGRWSEDQFLVILNGCREDSMHSVRERIRRLLLAGEGIEWWGEKRSLPILIGEATAQTGDSIESIMDRVQKSLASSAQLRTFAATTGGSPSSGG